MIQAYSDNLEKNIKNKGNLSGGSLLKVMGNKFGTAVGINVATSAAPKILEKMGIIATDKIGSTVAQ